MEYRVIIFGSSKTGGPVVRIFSLIVQGLCLARLKAMTQPQISIGPIGDLVLRSLLLIRAMYLYQINCNGKSEIPKGKTRSSGFARYPICRATFSEVKR